MASTRVLFITEGQLGDLLLLTPALRGLRRTFPSAHIAILVLNRQPHGRPSGSSLVQSKVETPLSTNPHVDEVYVVDRHSLRARRGLERVRAEVEIVRFLRKKRFNAVICTFPEDHFVLWAYASGAKIRVGQKGQTFDRLLTHALPIQKSEKGVREYYCNMVRALGVRIESLTTEYPITASAYGWASDFLRRTDLDSSRIVAVHPGASGDYKVWPPERYAELIDQLQGVPGVRVLLCCGPQDGKIISGIRGRLKTEIVQANPETVGQLAALLKKSALCICNDSGPRHLAVAVGTPSISLFRQHHSREWKVYPDTPTCMVLQSREKCPACPAGVCLDRTPGGKRYGSHCLWSLSTESVVRKVVDLLASL